MANKFQSGDKVRYVKEAPEDCGMTIDIGIMGICKTTPAGNIVVIIGLHEIPLKGICNITDCFEKID